MYLLIEGIDMSGKSTQVDMLKRAYRDAIVTREPGATKVGRKIREMLLNGEFNSERAEALAFVTDRAEHTAEVIKPNYDNFIISDRGFVSGVSYSAITTGDDINFLIRLNEYAMGDYKPSAIVILTIDEETFDARSALKEMDAIEKRGCAFFMRVQKLMVDVGTASEIPCIVLDGKDTKENIHNLIVEFYASITK